MTASSAARATTASSADPAGTACAGGGATIASPAALVATALAAADPFHLVRGAELALDAERRERQHQAASSRRSGGRKGVRASWRPELYRSRHRLLGARERLSERDRRRLFELFQREPVIAGAWGLKEAFRAVYAAADRTEAACRLDAFLAAVERAQIPSFAAFAHGIRLWREEINPRLLRRADHQRLRRGRDQQGQGAQAPRLRAADVRGLPRARPHSMRLTVITRGLPAGSARSDFSAGALTRPSRPSPRSRGGHPQLQAVRGPARAQSVMGTARSC